jgi:hypothetical protein
LRRAASRAARRAWRPSLLRSRLAPDTGES